LDEKSFYVPGFSTAVTVFVQINYSKVYLRCKSLWQVVFFAEVGY